MKIECILCPTDLSADSDEALRYAIALSRAYNAELILLHCDVFSDGVAMPDAHDRVVQAIRAALEKHSGSADLAGLDWRSLVVNCDDTGEAIAREAAKYGVDLIVMRDTRSENCRDNKIAAREKADVRAYKPNQGIDRRQLAQSNLGLNVCSWRDSDLP